MYATVRNYRGTPGLVDALLANEDAIRSLIGDIDGFRAYYLLRTEAGDAVSVSVYDDRAGADASTKAAGDWLRENLPDLAVGPPEVASGDVVIDF